jgi:hypothetical protein
LVALSNTTLSMMMTMINSSVVIISMPAIPLAQRRARISEGFDCPALETLLPVAPIAFRGRLVQYAGRILRPIRAGRPRRSTTTATSRPAVQASPAKRALDATMGAGTRARRPGVPEAPDGLRRRGPIPLAGVPGLRRP